MAERHKEEKGKSTVEEAGRKGGQTTKEKHGPEHFSDIGHKGGQRVREQVEEGREAERKK